VEALPEETQILLWGGCSFAVIPLKMVVSPNSTEEISETKVNDWILDARFIDFETVALVTAHNAISTYNVHTKESNGHFNCEEQSLLYAAQIYVGNHESLIATGTVFNEIQLWQLPLTSLKSKSQISNVPIAKRLRGHEGCIFSLRFDTTGSYLASCSDDRTIRVWDVKKGTCIAIGFAHIARVWDVQFIPSQPSEGLYLLSTSEDTTALLWQLDLSKKTLNVQERYHGHNGKHVWSEAISSDGRIAATGGNDGRLNIWDIGRWRQRLGLEASDICWREQTLKVQVGGKESVDVIKGYRCIDASRLLLTTDSG
jgi:WD repeat-containing protein 6